MTHSQSRRQVIRQAAALSVGAYRTARGRQYRARSSKVSQPAC